MRNECPDCGGQDVTKPQHGVIECRACGAVYTPDEEVGLVGDALVVPELEAVRGTQKRMWTASEVAVLNKYYGKVPTKALIKHTNHSVDSMHHKAASLGLSFDKKEA